MRYKLTFGFLFYLAYKSVTFILPINDSRVRCIVRNKGDEILLVKERLGNGLWNLPGGGIKKNESAEQAAARELKEEVGMDFAHAEIKVVGEVKHRHGLRTTTQIICEMPLFVAPSSSVHWNRKEIRAILWTKEPNSIMLKPIVQEALMFNNYKT